VTGVRVIAAAPCRRLCRRWVIRVLRILAGAGARVWLLALPGAGAVVAEAATWIVVGRLAARQGDAQQ
jgi:hypothetical protein